MRVVMALTLLVAFSMIGDAGIVIPFSGSGSSGSIAPGEPWAINAGTLPSWGSPGSGLGVLAWNSTIGDITDFEITFSGLPARVTISDLATPGNCAGGDGGGTVLCTGSTGTFLADFWTPVIGAGGNSITFDAPVGVALGPGKSYFVNVFFNASEGSAVNFTGGWSAVPEPFTVALTGVGLLAIAIRRRRSHA